MITVSISPDKSAAYLSPCMPNGSLHVAIEAAGGFMEFRNEEIATLPLSTDATQSLRRILTGKSVSIQPEDGRFLASFADASSPLAPYAIIPSRNGRFALLNEAALPLDRISAWRGYQTQQEGINRLEDGVFTIPLDLVPSVVKKFPQFPVSPGLRTIDVEQAQKDALFEIESRPANPVVDTSTNFTFDPVVFDSLDPFPQFDGSLISLKNVPLVEYSYIKEDLAKAERSRAKKKPVPLLKKLQKYGMNSAFDILHHFPLRHIDRSSPQIVRNLKPGDEASVVGTIMSKSTNREKGYIRFVVKDALGHPLSLMFFQQVWMGSVYFEGDEVIVYGKYAPFNGQPSMSKPRMDKIGDERARLPMIPVYPQSEKIGITTWEFVTILKETLARMDVMRLEEVLPDSIMGEYKIPGRADAYKAMHFPTSKQESVDASRRLVYEELYRLQLFIQLQKEDITRRKGIVHNSPLTPSIDSYMASLPYTLTNAQKRAVVAIEADMKREHPMHMLLQGDVGAGKTQLANLTILRTVDNGHQGALMAPTEILAEQLHNGICEAANHLISPRTDMPMNIRFLGGKTGVKDKREIYAGLTDGTIDIVVGTHGILSEGVLFSDLGAVVIDEQHRFGVEQRTKLRNVRTDGLTPDMLAMSATPIPRSSAMVLYGDMNITVLDELPPGRSPIQTEWIREDAQAAVTNPSLMPWRDIREQVEAGHQAYVVASLVEDNEKIAAQSVEDAYQTLGSMVFPDFKLGMVHGKQNRADREKTMQDFKDGKIDVLVSTTVIEVGVNVPNATVMVVLDPGRFGIAQLHQIRGRVGRSSLASRCYLLGDTKTAEGEFRLNALVESTDGFYLSEKDLELRGEGTLFSTQQSGDSDLYLAKIREHLHILEIAKADAERTIAADPKLRATRGNLILADEIKAIFGTKVIQS